VTHDATSLNSFISIDTKNMNTAARSKNKNERAKGGSGVRVLSTNDPSAYSDKWKYERNNQNGLVVPIS